MEDVSKGWAALPGYVATLIFERDTAKAKVQRANALLRRAEDFIVGFEDDEMQEGVKELLQAIRDEADITVTFATPDQRNKVYAQWEGAYAEFDDPLRVSQDYGGFWALGWLWVDNEVGGED